MELKLYDFTPAHLDAAWSLWNTVLEEGDTFPGEVPLTREEALRMFTEQTATVLLFADGQFAGLYVLHPNNIGRCGHIANGGYMVMPAFRGQKLGRVLVEDSIRRARECGFHGLQFNAVVTQNRRAISLYLSLGFRVVGTVPQGFRLPNGTYSDTLIMLKSWQ